MLIFLRFPQFDKNIIDFILFSSYDTINSFDIFFLSFITNVKVKIFVLLLRLSLNFIPL